MKDNRIKEEMEEEIVCKLWTQEPENFVGSNLPSLTVDLLHIVPLPLLSTISESNPSFLSAL